MTQENVVHELDEDLPLTQAQLANLFTRGLIDRATWNDAVLGLRSPGARGESAQRRCAMAIEVLVEVAMNTACGVIQQKLGVASGDLAATTLVDGTIERELTRYVRAELARVVPDAEVADVP